jgi:aminoglycoside/choline kinase family phosphotransferase
MSGALSPDALQPLERLLARLETPGVAAAPFTLSEIAGGASLRRFFRVSRPGRPSVMAMYVPAATPEVVKARELGRRWAFLEIRELLAARGVRVPELLAEDCEHGWLVVEDLGETLAQRLARAPEDRLELYQVAVRDLADAQAALAELPAESVIRTRAFDFELLRWEIEHFREWGLLARGVQLSDEDQAIFSAAADQLARTIAALPRGFVHRDYQSRNLMVPNEPHPAKLGWIDFQDAMLGPRSYDLVALLGDSYQSLDASFVTARLREFAERRGLTPELPALHREFRLITVQRKLKDAGRFVFIERSKSDASFLGFVAPTLALVLDSLAALADDSALSALRERLLAWRARILAGL